MHPYEIKTRMQERGHHHLIKLASASLYDAVERLEKGGFIAPQETSREGRRPERTVYALTQSGADELKRWMEELIALPAQEFHSFPAALAFLAILEKEEAVGFLERRAVGLEAQIAANETAIKSTREIGVPPLFAVGAEYAQAMAHAELAWVRELVGKIRTGGLWLTSR
jgi:DNA-binding PadR family transcriptional regulator